MNSFIELIDLTSGNVVGDFADRGEALTALRRTARRYGRPAIRNFSLMHIDGERQSLVAMQAELVAMVVACGRSPSPARSLAAGE